MSTGVADIHVAINALWEGSGLESLCKSYWTGETDKIASDFQALQDGDQTPLPPFPFCTYDLTKPRTVARMTHGASEKREVRDAVLTFHVWAKQTATKSAMGMATLIVEEITKVFGGHPTVACQPIVLVNGDCLQTTCQGDQYERVEGQRCHGVLDYKLLLDVPVAV